MILSKPYVSEVLANTLRQLKVPTLKADHVELPHERELLILSEREYFLQKNTEDFPLCNSENSLQLISKHLSNQDVLHPINLFKNKALFRAFMQSEYPHYYFMALRSDELDLVDPSTLPYPVIIKPSVGYSSIGVFRIEHEGEWHNVKSKIRVALDKGAEIYSGEVVNAHQLIIEKWIEGEEYAVDAYVDSEGEPVILNIFKRMFVNDGDTSDRIYYTSKAIIEETLQPLSDFLANIGNKLDLRRFPLHFEVRMTKEGHIIPIEVNPLRFAGVGTTELGMHAYGINSYEYFFKQIKPDWRIKLSEMDDMVYSFLCAEYELHDGGEVSGFYHDGSKLVSRTFSTIEFFLRNLTR